MVTKSLATYFPEHFLPVYSAEHIRRFLALLGGTAPADSPAWRSNRMLLELVRSRPEFEGWTKGEWCLEIIEELFEHFYVGPAEAEAKKAALDAKLAAAAKPPSK